MRACIAVGEMEWAFKMARVMIVEWARLGVGVYGYNGVVVMVEWAEWGGEGFKRVWQ